MVGQREGVSFFESSGYIEAPVSERTSFVITPWVEQNGDTLEGWRGEASFAAKRVVHRCEGGAVLQLQAGALWISHPWEGCGEGGVEVRALAGRNFGRTGFANVEAAAHPLDGGWESERLDLAIGYRPGRNWLAMGQVFVNLPRDGDETIRAQFTMVNFRPSGRAIQIGLRTRIDGGAQEGALVVGL